jgi:hypothetical protein
LHSRNRSSTAGEAGRAARCTRANKAGRKGPEGLQGVESAPWVTPPQVQVNILPVYRHRLAALEVTLSQPCGHGFAIGTGFSDLKLRLPLLPC